MCKFSFSVKKIVHKQIGVSTIIICKNAIKAINLARKGFYLLSYKTLQIQNYISSEVYTS